MDVKWYPIYRSFTSASYPPSPYSYKSPLMFMDTSFRVSNLCSSCMNMSESTLWINTSKVISGLTLWATLIISNKFWHAVSFSYSWASITYIKDPQFFKVCTSWGLSSESTFVPGKSLIANLMFGLLLMSKDLKTLDFKLIIEAWYWYLLVISTS